MPEFIVEILVWVEADSFTDAEALGERAASQAAKAAMPRSAGRAKIANVLVSDVRENDDPAAAAVPPGGETRDE